MFISQALANLVGIRTFTGASEFKGSFKNAALVHQPAQF